MRILIYDNNINDLEKLYTMIKLYPIQTRIDKVSSYDDCIDIFALHSYEMVFIDYCDDIGKRIATTICQRKPTQKVYLLNTHYLCFDDAKNCSDCKKQYNKETIIKPITQDQLSKIINKKYACESMNKNEAQFNLQKIKKLINTKYPYYKLDLHANEMCFSSDYLSTPMLVDITQLLHEHQLKFEVLDYKNIKLHLEE